MPKRNQEHAFAFGTSPVAKCTIMYCHLFTQLVTTIQYTLILWRAREWAREREREREMIWMVKKALYFWTKSMKIIWLKLIESCYFCKISVWYNVIRHWTTSFEGKKATYHKGPGNTWNHPFRQGKTCPLCCYLFSFHNYSKTPSRGLWPNLCMICHHHCP